MHIICAIQESVLNFQMKDLLFFSHDSFFPFSSLSYAGMCVHTHTHNLLVVFVLWAGPQYLSFSSSAHEKSLPRKWCFGLFLVFFFFFSPHKSQEPLLSRPRKLLLKQDFIPESRRHLRSRQVSGEPHSRQGCQGWTNIFIPWRICLLCWEHAKWMLTNIQLENVPLLRLLLNIPQETSSCLLNAIGC